MRKVRLPIAHAVFALVAMTPGLTTVVEATVHALAVDAVAESAAAHHEEHQDSERGCSGPFHVCTCHAPSLVGVARRPFEVRLDPPPFSDTGRREAEAPGPVGFRVSIFRPPIA